MRKRQHQVLLRLSGEELQQLQELVKKSGMTQQEYFRRAALQQRITNTDGIRTLVPELKKIGSNLNQVARRANMGIPATWEELLQIRKELSEVWQLLRQFLHTAA